MSLMVLSVRIITRSFIWPSGLVNSRPFEFDTKLQIAEWEAMGNWENALGCYPKAIEDAINDEERLSLYKDRARSLLHCGKLQEVKESMIVSLSPPPPLPLSPSPYIFLLSSHTSLCLIERDFCLVLVHVIGFRTPLLSSDLTPYLSLFTSLISSSYELGSFLLEAGWLADTEWTPLRRIRYLRHIRRCGSGCRRDIQHPRQISGFCER